jgi:transposase
MLDGDDGFGRRKLVQRTAAERAAIVAETYSPGATVAGVAARHGIQPSQLSAWRSAARKMAARKEAEAEQPLGFADVAVVPEPVLSAYDGIEIVLGVLVLRLPKSTPSKRVIEIARGVMAR